MSYTSDNFVIHVGRYTSDTHLTVCVIHIRRVSDALSYTSDALILGRVIRIRRVSDASYASDVCVIHIGVCI